MQILPLIQDDCTSSSHCFRISAKRNENVTKKDTPILYQCVRAHNKYHRPGKLVETYFLTTIEARSPESKCWEG